VTTLNRHRSPMKNLYSERQIMVAEFKYEVIGDPLFTAYVTQPNFGPETAQKALTMATLTYKLPLIVIVAQGKLYSDRQIEVGESKYGVAGDRYLQGVRGSHELLVAFWNPLHILGTVEVRNLKLDLQCTVSSLRA